MIFGYWGVGVLECWSVAKNKDFIEVRKIIAQ
jgi:hypothetical protein